jgi:hypothetical protein
MHAADLGKKGLIAQEPVCRGGAWAQDLDAPDDCNAAVGTRSKLRLCFGLEPSASALVLCSGRPLGNPPLM